MFSDEEIREMFEVMGVSIIEETCLFLYTDAPTGFVYDIKWVVERLWDEKYGWVDTLVQKVEMASATWKRELMFFDGATLAFGTGSKILTSDYCCN